MPFLDKIFLQILSALICTLSPANIFPPNYIFSLFLEALSLFCATYMCLSVVLLMKFG